MLGKVEKKTGYQYFSPISSMFLEFLFFRVVKVWNCVATFIDLTSDVCFYKDTKDL